MREALVVVVLVGAGLAGCIGATDTPTDGASDPGPEVDARVPTLPNGTVAPTTLAFQDCAEQAASFPVPASAYEGRLPDGFSLEPYGALVPSASEPTGETAELIVLGYACEGSDASAALSYLLVDPPGVWANPDATFGHAILLSMAVPSEETAHVYEAWGLGPAVSVGEVRLEATATPAARLGTTTASADGATVQLETTVEGQPSELEAAEVRWFAVDDAGNVTGAMDVNWTALQVTIGEATVTGSGFGTWEDVPAQPGLGFHNWGFDQWASHVDLPPREAS